MLIIPLAGLSEWYIAKP